VDEKLKPVPKPKLGDLEIFKKGNFDMRKFQERQGMADLAKFKEFEDAEMDKLGKDADEDDGAAVDVRSAT
jgi:hypothetical protein